MPAWRIEKRPHQYCTFTPAVGDSPMRFPLPSNVKRVDNNKKRCRIETMKPRTQSFYVEADIANDTGYVRGIFIAVNRCLPKPYGCGGEATEFNNEPSEREYAMSGLCQKCQDKFFGE